jgi:DNA-binding response OmpR family regulator
VDEDGAAAAGDSRPVVVVDLDDEVVEGVVAAQPVAQLLRSPLKRLVVASIMGVFAPGVVGADAANRQGRQRPRQPVSLPPQPQRTKPAARRGAVALALVGLDAGAAKRDGQRQRACQEPALRRPARPSAHADEGQRSPPHRFRPDSQGPLALVSCPFYVVPGGAAKPAVGVELPNTRKILIVDDDAELRDGLTEQLSLHEEFEAVGVESGSKGVQAAKAGQIDLVIMDVGLPDIDGREAVRILRKNGFKAPIIMLTGHDTDSDTILGLESGANDYVTKPFRFAVLLARIRAQLRQHEASEDAVFTIGPYTFRPSSKLLLNPKGNKVRLTEKETSILRYLYRAGQRPVSRETLLQEVWGYNSGVTTHTLETHIYRLRQKIEKDAAAPAILVTEAGGYKLVP